MLVGSRAAQAIKCCENAFLTSCHYTAEALNKMTQVVFRPEAHFSRDLIDSSYFMNEIYCFLDIGSGFAYPNYIFAETI